MSLVICWSGWMYSTLSLPASLGLNLYYSLPNAWFVHVVPCFQGFLNLYEITFFDVLYTCPIISSFLPGSPLYLARGQDFETYSLWNYIRSDLISSHFASNDFLGIAYIYSRSLCRLLNARDRIVHRDNEKKVRYGIFILWPCKIQVMCP